MIFIKVTYYLPRPTPVRVAFHSGRFFLLGSGHSYWMSERVNDFTSKFFLLFLIEQVKSLSVPMVIEASLEGHYKTP